MNNVSLKLDHLCTEGNNKFWKYLKSIKNAKPNNLPESEQFLHHFKTLHTAKKSDFNDKIQQKVNETINNLSNRNGTYKVITPTEIEKAINLLKTGKAHGQDLITNEMLKHAKHIILDSLCKLFNMIIQTGKYPSEWCTGHIVPIFKADDNSEPKNYRGITINNYK
jgi:hypothetical protein